VTGHSFSVFLRFKGGKGVATALGVFLALSPQALLISLLVFILTVFATGFVSLGSILAAAAMLPSLYFFGEASWKCWLAAYVVLLIWLKHHQNIKRLLNGTEKRFRDKENIAASE
jgi:glycerol-3-phosphate acyltransferase PlsY